MVRGKIFTNGTCQDRETPEWSSGVIAILLLLLLSVPLVKTARAQSTDSTRVRTARIEVVDRDVLPLDLSIRALRLSPPEVATASPSSTAAPINMERFIKSVAVWGPEPMSRTERWTWDTIPLADARARYDLSLQDGDPDLIRLILRHRAKRIYRPYPPSMYDTLTVARDGRVVPQHEFSRRFNIVFPDSLSRNAFLGAAGKLSTVEFAIKPFPPSALELN